MKFTTLISTLTLLVGSVIAQGEITTSGIPSSPTPALSTPSPFSQSDVTPSISVPIPTTSSVIDSGVVSILPITTTTTTSRPSSTTTSTTTRMDSISQSSPSPSETGSVNGGLPTALAGMQQVAMGVVAGLVGAVVL